MNCVLTLPQHFFSKNYWGNEPDVSGHFLSLSGIQLYLEARKSLTLNGKCEIQVKFFGFQKTIKTGKAGNGEKYCSATMQYHNNMTN